MDMIPWFGGGTDKENDNGISQRTTHITDAAAQVFGDYERARQWVQDNHSGFGGSSLQEYLKSGTSEQTVLNELRHQADATRKDNKDY